MAFCTQTLAGIARDCQANQGGIREAYIGNYVDGAFTVSAGTITAINSGASFYHYTFKKDTGSFTSTLNVDNANGINYVSTEINFVFSRMETLKRIEMAALALGDLIVVVKDANGKYWAFGVEEPVNASAGSAATGVARGDANQYTITLLDNAASFPMELSSSAISTLETATTEPTSANS